MAFIDIHGHYAWDIDDGMPSLEDAKKALEKAKIIVFLRLSQHLMLFLENTL